MGVDDVTAHEEYRGEKHGVLQEHMTGNLALLGTSGKTFLRNMALKLNRDEKGE